MTVKVGLSMYPTGAKFVSKTSVKNSKTSSWLTSVLLAVTVEKEAPPSSKVLAKSDITAVSPNQTIGRNHFLDYDKEKLQERLAKLLAVLL